MTYNAEYWIRKFELQKHPEGGWFRETYRSEIIIDRESLPLCYPGNRNVSTAIYFLLEKDEVSAFHRLLSDEIWFFHCGSPLLIHKIDPSGKYSSSELGADSFHEIIHAETWFAAEVCDKNSFSLVSCTVAPGFDFTDFELAEKETLTSLFPEHKNIIERFT